MADEFGGLQLTIGGFESFDEGLSKIQSQITQLNGVINQAVVGLNNFESKIKSVAATMKATKFELDLELSPSLQGLINDKDTIKNVKSVTDIIKSLKDIVTSADQLANMNISTNKEIFDNLTELFKGISNVLREIGLITTTSTSLLSNAKGFKIILEELFKVVGEIKNSGSISIDPATISSLNQTMLALDPIFALLRKFNLIEGVNIENVSVGLRSLIGTIKSLSEFSSDITRYEFPPFPSGFTASISGLFNGLSGLGKYAWGSIWAISDRLTGSNDLIRTLTPFMNTLAFIAKGLQPLASLPPFDYASFSIFLASMVETIGQIGKFGDSLTKGANDPMSTLSKLRYFLTGVLPLSQAIQDFTRTMRVIGESMKGFGELGQMLSGMKDPSKFITGIAKLINTIVAVASTLKTLQLKMEDLQQQTGFIKNLIGMGKNAGPIGIVTDLFRTLGQALRVFYQSVQGGFFSRKIDFEALDQMSDAISRLSRSLKSISGLGDIRSKVEELRDTLPLLGRALSATFPQKSSEFTNIGMYITAGLAGGMVLGIPQLRDVAFDMSKGLLKVFTSVLGIASPSKITRRYGEDVVQGFENGVSNKASQLYTSGYDTIRMFVNGIMAAKSFVTSSLNSFVDNIRNTITSGLATLGRNFRDWGRDAFDFGRDMAITGGLVSFFQSQQLQLVAVFDQIMTQIQTFGSLTDQELSKVNDVILDFSARTIFNPEQSANAFLGLQKAGLSAAESTAVLVDVGNLAAAGNVTLEQSTLGVVAAMQTYGLATTDATHIANVYSQAANNSTAEVNDLIQGMGNVGPIANQFGLSFEETTAILATFNDRGLRGAEAGTQLKSMLTNLVRPTEDLKATFAELGVSLADGEGNIKSLDTILNELRTSLYETKSVTYNVTKGLSDDQQSLLESAEKQYGRTTQKIMQYESGLITLTEKQKAAVYDQRDRAANVMGGIVEDKTVLATITKEISRTQYENFQAIQKLAGTYGQAGLAILLGEDEDAIASFLKEMEGLPTAAETSASMMDTLKGAMESFKGSIQTLIIKAMQPLINTVFKPFFAMGTQLVNMLANLPSPILGAVSALALLAAGLTTLIGIGFLLVGSILIPLGLAFSAVAGAMTAVLFVLTNPVGLIAGFIVIIGTFGTLIAIIGGVVGSFALLTSTLTYFYSEAKQNESVVYQFNLLKESVGALFEEFNALFGNIANFVVHFLSIEDSTQSATNKFEPLTNAIMGFRNMVNDVLEPLKQFNDLLTLIPEVDAYVSGGYTSRLEAAQAEVDAANAQLATFQSNDAVRVAQGMAPQNMLTPQASTYLVQDNDSWARIAENQKLSVQQLKDMNEQITGGLHPGMLLVISDQQVLAGNNQDYLDAVTAQQAAQFNLNSELQKENTQRQLLRTEAKLEGETAIHYLDEETKYVGGLNEKIKEFSQTALGARIFDFFNIDTANISGFTSILTEITTSFYNIKFAVQTIGDSIVSIFQGGDLSSGINNILNMFTNILGESIRVVGMLIGQEFTGSFVDAVMSGDFGNVINYFTDNLFGDLKLKIIMAIPDIAQTLGNFAQTAYESILNFFLGKDNPILTSLFPSGSEINTIVYTFISQIGAVLMGTQDSMRIAFVTMFSTLGIAKDQLNRIYTFFQLFVEDIKGVFDTLTSYLKGENAKYIIAVISAIIGYFFNLQMVMASFGLYYLIFEGLAHSLDPILFTIVEIGKYLDGVQTLEDALYGVAAGITAIALSFVGGVGEGIARILDLLGKPEWAERIREVSNQLLQLADPQMIKDKFKEWGSVVEPQIKIIFDSIKTFIAEQLVGLAGGDMNFALFKMDVFNELGKVSDQLFGFLDSINIFKQTISEDMVSSQAQTTLDTIGTFSEGLLGLTKGVLYTAFEILAAIAKGFSIVLNYLFTGKSGLGSTGDSSVDSVVSGMTPTPTGNAQIAKTLQKISDDVEPQANRLQQIFNVLKIAFGFFIQIMEGLYYGGFDVLKIIFEGISNAINDQVLEPIRKFVQGFAGLNFKEAAQKLQTDIAIIGEIVQVVKDYFTTEDAINTLYPFIFFASILKRIGQLWFEAFGKLIESIESGDLNPFDGLLDNIASFSVKLATFFTTIEETLTLFFDTLKDKFKDFPIIVAALGVVSSIILTIIGLFAMLSTSASQVATGIATVNTTVAALATTTAGGGIAAYFISGFATLAGWLIIIPLALYGLAGAFRGLMEIIAGFGQTLRGLVEGDMEMFTNGIGRMFAGLIAAIVGFIANIAKVIRFVTDKLGLEGLTAALDNIIMMLETFKQAEIIAKVAERIGTALNDFILNLGVTSEDFTSIIDSILLGAGVIIAFIGYSMLPTLTTVLMDLSIFMAGFGGIQGMFASVIGGMSSFGGFLSMAAYAVGILAAKIALLLVFFYALYGALPGLINILVGFGEVIGGIFKFISTGELDQLFHGIARIAAGTIGAIAGFIGNIGLVMAKILEVLGFEELATRVRDLSHLLKEFAKGEVIKAMTEKFAAAIGLMFDTLENGFDKWKEMFSTIKEIFQLYGLDSIEGFVNGIKVALNYAKDQIIGFFEDNVIQPIKDFLGISSPSTLFMQIGTDLITGLILGIAKMIPLIITGFKVVANAIINMWKTIPGTIINGLSAAFNLASSIDWIGIATSIVVNLFSAISQALTTAGNISASLSSMGMSLLNSLLTGIGNIHAWVGDNIVTPIKNALIDKLKTLFDISGKESADLGELGTQVKEYLKTQIITGLAQISSGDFVGAFQTLKTTFINMFNLGERVDSELGISDKIKGWIVSGIANLTTKIAEIDLTTLKTAFVTMISSAISSAVSFGEDAAGAAGVAIDWLSFGIKLIIKLALGIQEASLTASTTLLNATQTLATKVLEGLASGFGSMTTWVETNFINPLVNAISALAPQVLTALDNLIPDQFTLDFGSVDFGAPFGVFDFGGKTIDIPDTPFTDAAKKLAFGGSVSAGSTYEVLEKNKQVPFEMFESRGKSYMLANQGGMMRSPLREPNMFGKGDTYFEFKDNITISIEGSGLSPDELQGAITNGIRMERENNPLYLELKRRGI